MTKAAKEPSATLTESDEGAYGEKHGCSMTKDAKEQSVASTRTVKVKFQVQVPTKIYWK